MAPYIYKDWLNTTSMAGWDWLKRLKILLPLIGIGIFVLILHDIGVENLGRTLSNINPWLFVTSLVIFAPRIFISTYRWKMLAALQGIHLPLLLFIRFNLIGLFYGTITPLWLGDYIRIPLLHQSSTDSMGKCASNVVIDQLMELSALFILALAGSLLLISAYPYLPVILFGVFFSIVGVVLYLKEKRRSRRLLQILYHLFIPAKLKASMAREFHAFYTDIPPVRALVVPALIGIMGYFLYFVQIYLIALSFDVTVPFFDFVLLYPVASLIGLLPITVSGLGTREGVLIKLFSIYGVARDVTVAISLGGYIITMLIPAIIGGLLALGTARKNV